jgi:hypothetical protein
VEDHVTGNEADFGIRIHCTVVEQLGERFEGSLGAVGLLGGKGANGGQHGRVDGMGIEQ